jgi:hypothetical protein
METDAVLVDLAAMRQHRTTIAVDDSGAWISRSRLETMSATMHVWNHLGRAGAEGLNRHVGSACGRLADLRTVVWKLEWMREMRDLGELDSHRWMYFAASDIASFLTDVTAVCDHLGRALYVASPQAGKLPRSFGELRRFVAQSGDTATAQLGSRGTVIVDEADWFSRIGPLRNAIVHENVSKIVFPSEPGIAFQLWSGDDLLLDEPSLLGPNKIARFERFAAAVTGRLHVLSEDIANHVLATFPAEEIADSWSRHPGLGVLAVWTDEFLAIGDP